MNVNMCWQLYQTNFSPIRKWNSSPTTHSRWASVRVNANWLWWPRKIILSHSKHHWHCRFWRYCSSIDLEKKCLKIAFFHVCWNRCCPVGRYPMWAPFSYMKCTYCWYAAIVICRRAAAIQEHQIPAHVYRSRSIPFIQEISTESYLPNYLDTSSSARSARLPALCSGPVPVLVDSGILYAGKSTPKQPTIPFTTQYIVNLTKEDTTQAESANRTEILLGGLASEESVFMSSAYGDDERKCNVRE